MGSSDPPTGTSQSRSSAAARTFHRVLSELDTVRLLRVPVPRLPGRYFARYLIPPASWLGVSHAFIIPSEARNPSWVSSFRTHMELDAPLPATLHRRHFCTVPQVRVVIRLPNSLSSRLIHFILPANRSPIVSTEQISRSVSRKIRKFFSGET